jgi:hypothetical protein
MEWVSITGSWRYQHGESQPGLWDREPAEGSLPARQAALLASVLEQHTSTPERCWFAVWDGFGGRYAFRAEGVPTIELPHRPMFLLSGPLSAAATTLVEFGHQSASLWWPDDRSWCVATDVDLMSTYLGGAEAAIDALVAVQDLEAMRVSVGQGLTYDTDTLNPAPSGPSPYDG